jgi:hypothetical protein
LGRRESQLNPTIPQSRPAAGFHNQLTSDGPKGSSAGYWKQQTGHFHAANSQHILQKENKMKKVIFIPLLLSCLLFGSDKKWRDRDFDGDILGGETIFEGQKYQIITFSKQKKKAMTTFYQNKKTKLLMFFHENGNIEGYFDFRNPEDLKEVRYYDNGQLAKEIHANEKSGKEFGKKYFDRNGKPITVDQFIKIWDSQ